MAHKQNGFYIWAHSKHILLTVQAWLGTPAGQQQPPAHQLVGSGKGHGSRELWFSPSRLSCALHGLGPLGLFPGLQWKKALGASTEGRDGHPVSDRLRH